MSMANNAAITHSDFSSSSPWKSWQLCACLESGMEVRRIHEVLQLMKSVDHSPPAKGVNEAFSDFCCWQ